MTHVFFQKNDNFETVEQFDYDQFIVEIAFAPDDTQLDLLFDTDDDGYPQLVANIEQGVWQHMICRVRATYDGKVMGESYLGSVISASPQEWLDESQDIVDDMVREAVDQARGEAVRMLEILKPDFLGMPLYQDVDQKVLETEN